MEKSPENKDSLTYWKPFKTGESVKLKEVFRSDKEGIKSWRVHFEKLGLTLDRNYEIEEVDPEFITEYATRDPRGLDTLQMVKIKGMNRWLDATYFEREINDPYHS